MMTPQFSRQLALAVNSPYFSTAVNPEQRARFVQQATQYPTLDAMPARLQEVYRRAMASRDETTEQQ